MNKLLIYLLTSFSLFFLAAYTFNPEKPETQSCVKAADPCLFHHHMVTKAGDFKWLSYDEAQKLASKSHKKIFVDVYTDWCGWCKKMDQTTLKNPEIRDYLSKKFYAVKLNAESTKKVTYKGREITEQELATKVFRATGYPTTVYLDEEQNVLQPISSFLEVETLDKILHYYGENYYKNTSWETFESIYSKDAN
jgi:thioredoxin-related protein